MNAARPLEIVMPDWAAITAVILGITTFAISEGLTYPLISLALESRGVSETIIGLNATIFAFGLAAATLSIGRLTALFAGDKLILVGLMACSFSLLTFAITDSVIIWFAARFLLGFGASLVFILSEAWLSAACPDHLRGRVSGIYGAGMCAGFAAGPLAIPLLGSESGFAFALAATYLAVITFAAAILSRRARTRPEPSPAGALMRFARTAPVLVAIVLAFGFADVAAISVMPVYFVESGHSESFAAVSVTVLALPTALAQPVVGALLDRISRMSVAIGCGFVTGFAFLAIPLLQSEAAILAVFALLGAASFALYTCALTLLGERYRGGLLVAGSAVFSLAYAIGSAGGSTLTGFAMAVFSPAAAPISAGLALTVFAALAVAARRP